MRLLHALALAALATAPLAAVVGPAAAAPDSGCGLLDAFNCGSIAVTKTGGACVRSGAGLSETVTCAPSEWTATATASRWLNAGALEAGASGDGWAACSSDAGAAAWSGVPVDAGGAVVALRVSCDGFTYGMGQCGYVNVGAWVDFFGLHAPGRMGDGGRVSGGCVP